MKQNKIINYTDDIDDDVIISSSFYQNDTIRLSNESFDFNIEDEIDVYLNNIHFTSYNMFYNYIIRNIYLKNYYYCFDIITKNNKIIPSFRNKDKVIAYIHCLYRLQDKLLDII